MPASVAYRIAIGPHAGRKALTLYSVPPVEIESHIDCVGGAPGVALGQRLDSYRSRTRIDRQIADSVASKLLVGQSREQNHCLPQATILA